MHSPLAVRKPIANLWEAITLRSRHAMKRASKT